MFSTLLSPMRKNANALKIMELKRDIKAFSKGTQNGIDCNDSKRQKVAECVKVLEGSNSVRDISSSLLLDGNWKLVYTTNEGSSAGKFGPFVGAVYQEIDIKNKFYLNKVILFNGIVTGILSATWIKKSNNLWTVKFQDIILRVLGIKVVEKNLNGTEGIWRTTYLDEDFRILYAIGGKNTIKENVYILEKLVTK
jgi:hypothetical protein